MRLFESDRSIFADVIHNLLDKSIECLHMANGDDVAMGTLESMAEALLVRVCVCVCVLLLSFATAIADIILQSLVELTVKLRIETKEK